MEQARPATGVFALEWENFEIDGVRGLDSTWLRPGATWVRSGACIRLDHVRAGVSAAEHEMHQRARAMARRLSGRTAPPPAPPGTLQPAPAHGFVLTDGTALYIARLIPRSEGTLVVFERGVPPEGRTCWVIASDIAPGQPLSAPEQEVICFASDALIATPDGARPIAGLKRGDRVITRDNGPQPVLWVGQTTLSGLALRQHPHLRPIRLRQNALLDGLPDDDLCVSPAHRIVLRGPKARDLFGADEVLAQARDLVDYRTILPDLALHGVTYVHLLFAAHQIIFANGIASESFHPAFAPPMSLKAHRAGLEALGQDWLSAPERYGPPARRCLSAGEAGLLAA